MYTEKVLDHFHHPRHAGAISGATAAAESANFACGDIMKLWAVVREGKVVEVGFKAEGCVPSVACGSWLTERMLGRALPELGAISAEEIEAGLGELPTASRHASALAVDALKQLLRAVERDT